MTLNGIPRRTVLFASAAALLAPAAPAMAATVPPPPPSGVIPVPIPGSTPVVSAAKFNGVSVSAITYTSQDAAAIAVVVQNTNRNSRNIVVTYTDTGGPKKGRQPIKITVPAGQSRSFTIYGHLTHQATLHFKDNIGGILALLIKRGKGGRLPRSAGPSLLNIPPSRSEMPTGGTAGVRSGPRRTSHTG